MIIEQLSDNSYTGLSINSLTGNMADFAATGMKPLDVSGVAGHRLQNSPFHQMAWTGSRTTDMFLCMGGKYFLAHTKSFTANHAAVFQKAHSNGVEMPLSRKIISKAIEIKSDSLDLYVRGFENNPVARFLFGEHTENYAKWLDELKIPAVPILLPPKTLTAHYPGDFMRPLIIRCTDNWSGIITSNTDLQHSYGFRGHSEKAGGPVKPEETFSADSLVPYKSLLPLQEGRNYGLNEITELARAEGILGLLNPVLRLIRTKGSTLPANFDTDFG